MRMNKLLAAVAASSLIATPVMANTAAPLSVAKVAGVKASTSAKKSNKLSGIGIAVIATVVIVGGAAAAGAFDGGSDSN